MSLLFGGGSGSTPKPQFTGLGVQTSTTTVPITQSWGYGRQAGNIIWQDDFKSVKHTQSSGGKGGAPDQVSYTYTASFAISMGWGVFGGCDMVWKDQSKIPDYTTLGFTLFTGTIPQSPWGYLVANHPAQAMGYPGLGYFGVANYDLGDSNIFPQHSFLMRRSLYNTAPGAVGDADPALVTDDFLNNTTNGVLLGSSSIETASLMSTGAAPTTGDNAFQTYCKAMGFGFSPELESQEKATDILLRWTAIFNTALVYTGYSLRFLPYGPDTVTANGVTYLPNFVSQYTLTDKNFIASEGDDPVVPNRVSPQDVKNSLAFEIKNRHNEYNTEPAPWQDQGLIDQYGLKPDSVYQAHEIKEPVIGATCAALMGQRNAYQRNEFDFALPPSFMLLEPGDIVTLVDSTFGPTAVMLKEITEQDDDSFEMIAKEFNGSVASSGLTQTGGVTNTPIDTGVSGGPVNTPIIFEPPSSLTGDAEVWAAVSGGAAGVANPNWGGAYVWVSLDGVNYSRVGSVTQPARMGVTTGALAAYASANPDTTHSVAVNLAESAGTLISTTASDAAAFSTLCYLGGELLSYRDATLTSAYHYTLGGQLYRGLYGTVAGSHSSGVDFARLDEAVFKYKLPTQYIGQTLHFKFQSFNIFGTGVQDIATCTAYTYATTGTGYGGGTGGAPLTPTGLSGSAGAGFAKLVWTANSVNDNVTTYEVWRATGPSGSSGSAVKIGSSSTPTYTDTSGVWGTTYTYFVKAVNSIGSSGFSSGTDLTSTQPTVTLTFATAAEVQAGTSGTKPIAPDHLQTAAVPQVLTPGATINWDMSLGFNAKATLGSAANAFQTPTNPKEGVTYRLELIQDGTGTRTATFPTAFDFGGSGTPVLSTAASKHDFIFLDCYDAATPKFRASFNKGT